jgi:hypothetical protein
MTTQREKTKKPQGRTVGHEAPSAGQPEPLRPPGTVGTKAAKTRGHALRDDIGTPSRQSKRSAEARARSAAEARDTTAAQHRNREQEEEDEDKHQARRTRETRGNKGGVTQRSL